MEKIVDSVLDFRKMIDSGRVLSVNGNTNLSYILLENHAFSEAVVMIANEPKNENEKNRVGRPSLDYSPTVKCLYRTVEEFYQNSGFPEMSDNHKSSLKQGLSRAFESGERVAEGSEGCAFFFDSDKSKHWIDVFSALQDKYGIISKTDSPAEFIDGYRRLFGRLNTGKLIPFYSRWIREISAMYTIYKKQNYDFYEAMHQRLGRAWSAASKAGKRGVSMNASTDHVKEGVINIICNSSDTETVISRLEDYVSRNYAEFTYDVGRIRARGNRSKRYYCTVTELLKVARGTLNEDGYLNKDVEDAFLVSGVDYDVKDGVIESLEYDLLSMIYDCISSDSISDTDFFRYFTGDPFCVFSHEDCAVVSYNAKEKLYSKRSINKITESVVELLRFIYIVDRIRFYCANPSLMPEADTVISGINKSLADMGLVQLSVFPSDRCTVGRELDWCLEATVRRLTEEL